MNKPYTIKVSAIEHNNVSGELQVEAEDEAEAMMKAVMNRDQINWDYRVTGSLNNFTYKILE